MRKRSLLFIAPFTLLSAQQPVFEPVQSDLFKEGGTLTNAWADYDRDGDLDLFVGFNGTPNRLYRNDGGRFRDVAAEAGLADARPTRAAAWGDYDGDLDADLLLGFAPGAGPVLRLYRNDGGRFTDVTGQAGLAMDSAAVRQPSWIDFDNDGDLDLFMAFRDRANALFVNDRGTFRDVARIVGLADPRKSVGALWFDFEEDGDLDLYVANQDGDANGLFRNVRGRFTDVADSAGAAWGGRTPKLATNGTVRPCAADVNNDGRLDLFLANYGKNGLLLNKGDGTFEDVSEAWGVATDGRYDTCAFADYDHDGLIDVYVNGTVTGGQSYRDYLLRNTGGKFEDATPANILAYQASHGAQWADFDNDGDLDLSLAGTRADMSHPLLRNDVPSARRNLWLSVSVIDERGRQRHAGAELRIFASGTNRVLGTRLLDTGSGYNSQGVQAVHFGLPDTDRIDLEITYIANGRSRARFARIDPANADDRRLEIQINERGNAKLVRGQGPRT